jgi:hypothetical protein
MSFGLSNHNFKLSSEFQTRSNLILLEDVLYSKLTFSSWKDSDDASSPTDIDIYNLISLNDRDLEY